MSDTQETIPDNEAPIEDGANNGVTETPPVDDTPPVRRRRGRPPKDANAPVKEGVSGTAPKRGRPAKTDKKVYSADDISVMGRQLVGLHMMVAQITQIPEAQLSDAEGQLLAQSIIQVADQYDLAIDGKTGAALQLFATAAMIYAPRAIAFKQRQKATQAQRDDSTVVAQ